MKSIDFLQEIVKIINDKKGLDIKVLKISGVSTLADYFVIASGTSVTHTKAIFDEIEEKSHIIGFDILHKEGTDTGRWILIDTGSIIIHIFTEEDRKFYDLERLWSNAEKIDMSLILER